MRTLRLLVITALALLLWPTLPARAVAIPAYTPNVVDPAGVLTAAERQRVNASLQQVRDTQGIWGAVYIVPSLDGRSIEELAERAFKTWQLGQKSSDNGLLLVLSMQERRSRFEVGYGLEGSLPDMVAKHALDDYLAPRMRQGDTAGAIVDAFGFMARVAAKDPDSVAELSHPTSRSGGDDKSDWVRGGIAWAGLLTLVWLLPPLQRHWMRHLRARLLRHHPELGDAPEDIAESKRKQSSFGLFLKLFLTLNPGVFVLVLSALFPLAFWLWIAAELLAPVLILALSGRRYRSPQRFRAFLQQQARKRKALIRKGHVVETAPGAFAYTAAYYASEAASSSSSGSSSSSSGSSSGSSSSGGGSSGGGGASSSW
ncbi:TPM domain-containing protein [Xanthomonas campestris pv. phormiicola]|nr:TPM domain-containing protein [Xanthomonas campestris pv. phormiicola]UYC14537.1 TPM domain-containing protein [Xanthomonas campestris pv. phormiicola]